MNTRTLTFALLACACLASPALGQQASPVRVAEVFIQQSEQHRMVTGDLRAVSRSSVGSIESGIVLELPIEAGQTVKAGDVLAVLDARRLKLELLQVEARKIVAEAVVIQRQAELDQANFDLELLEKANSERAVNIKELADARSAVKINEALLAAAQKQLDVLAAEIDLLNVRLGDTTITAPFDGSIIRKQTEVGQWLAAGDPVAEIVATGAVEAWLNIPQRYARSMSRPESKVMVEVASLKIRFDPTRPTIIRDVDLAARAFSAVITLPDQDGVLKPGMAVTAWIPTGIEGEFMFVPRDAVTRQGGQSVAYMVVPGENEQQVAVPAVFNVIFETNTHVAIDPSSLPPGTQVVVEGNERLFPGSPVIPQPAESATVTAQKDEE
jgi:RND family efflux transporter MFP subunit